ncbi:Ribosomal protein S24/S35 [Perilla frutescens var. hirtella]|uniref:Ribosomal protein S24/S35 n=1 Tax=Perilla frutescens var. hirtella TaxID=608512 RepID=A0AAD4J6I6_PERFH|nr:Ribosomal protein S24/S35 [Perilla frutescens var. hirtella]
MRGALLRNLSLYTRNHHFSLKLKPTPLLANACTNFHRKIDTAVDNAQMPNFFPSRIRFYSSENGTQDPDPNPESASGVVLPEEETAAAAEVEDVDNKELKTQIEEYLSNGNEEALPTVFESVLKRKLLEKHEETDDELMDELQLKPLEDVNDEDFESDFEDALETDEEIEDLYNARDIVMKRMSSDPYFNMNDKKWDEMIKEATEHGYLQDMRECEDILEDMLNWDKLLPDEIKKKVEEKFNEIGDRIEKGELDVEEGFELFKEFEDQMVLECGKLMEAEGPPQFDKDDTTSKNVEPDDPPGEGPILRWQTRVVFAPGGDAWHPKNRKVKLSVTVKELGLTKHQFVRLRELAGKRYTPGKDELTITSERFEHREENRKDCLRTLLALIEEAGKARTMVHEARVSDVKDRLKANPNFMQRLQSKKKAPATDPATTS